MIVDPPNIESQLELWWYRQVERQALARRQPRYTYPGDTGASQALFSIQLGLEGYSAVVAPQMIVKVIREFGDTHLDKKQKKVK